MPRPAQENAYGRSAASTCAVHICGSQSCNVFIRGRIPGRRSKRISHWNDDSFLLSNSANLKPPTIEILKKYTSNIYPIEISVLLASVITIEGCDYNAFQ